MYTMTSYSRSPYMYHTVCTGLAGLAGELPPCVDKIIWTVYRWLITLAASGCDIHKIFLLWTVLFQITQYPSEQYLSYHQYHQNPHQDYYRMEYLKENDFMNTDVHNTLDGKYCMWYVYAHPRLLTEVLNQRFQRVISILYWAMDHGWVFLTRSMTHSIARLYLSCLCIYVYSY